MPIHYRVINRYSLFFRKKDEKARDFFLVLGCLVFCYIIYGLRRRRNPVEYVVSKPVYLGLYAIEFRVHLFFKSLEPL